jgi:hypothetical protein
MMAGDKGNAKHRDDVESRDVLMCKLRIEVHICYFSNVEILFISI